MISIESNVVLFHLAEGAVEFALNWLLQSTLLIAGGLTIARLLHGHGSAVQSLVYRTTMVAVLVCPVATGSLSRAGIPGWSLRLPSGWSSRPEANSPVTAGRRDSVPGTESSGRLTSPAAPSASLPDWPYIEPATSMSGQPDWAAAPVADIDVKPVAGPIAEIAPRSRRAASEKVSGAVAQLVGNGFGFAAIGLTVCWCFASGLLGLRLAVSWRRLRQLRRDGSPAGAEIQHGCEQVASLLGVSAPGVVCSPYLSSPCLVGLRKPVILLPEGDLILIVRDVLIHELAHLKRHDGYWNLLRHAATSLFFFQPLLWKLSRLLEATAEEVCDDYVIQYGSDRREYAHRLVNIAEQYAAPGMAGVGIVSLRSMLARRIARIMDPTRTVSVRVGHLLLATVLVGGAMGTGGAALLGLSPQSSQAEKASPGEQDVLEAGSANQAGQQVQRDQEAESAAAEVDEGRQEFKGRVVTPDGRPVRGAELYFVFHVPEPTGLLVPVWEPVAKTDAAGSFRFAAGPRDLGVQATTTDLGSAALVAVKDGYGFAWSQAGRHETSGKWLAAARSKLDEAPPELREWLERMLTTADEPLRLIEDDSPIRGRFVDINGQPVSGARLTLREVATGPDDDLSDWRAAAQEQNADFYSARMKTPRYMNGPQARSLVRPAVSDDQGRCTLRGVGRGRVVQLLVEAAGHESTLIFARTEAGQAISLPRERRFSDLGVYTYHPAEFTLVLGPSVAIAGVIRDAETGAPLPGVTVKSQSRHGERISGWGQDFVRAVSDEQGRYRLDGMPIGSDNRIAAIAPTGNIAYLSQIKPAATTAADSTREIDFELRRGVWIEGRITDKATGDGLAGRLTYYLAKENPDSRFGSSMNVDQRDRLRSDQEGRFKIAALPGPGFLAFLADQHQDYPRADTILRLDGNLERVEREWLETRPSFLTPQNYHLVSEVNPSADEARVELNLQLDGGKRVVGRVLGPDGRPVTGYYYSGQMAHFSSWRPAREDRFELQGHDPATPRHLYFVDLNLNLAAHVLLLGEPPEDYVVRLQPAGKVQGRLVDREGAPLAHYTLVPWSPPIRTPDDLTVDYHAPPLPRNVAHSQVGQYETDAEGRFEIAGLAPDVAYQLRAFDIESRSASPRRVTRASGPLSVAIQVASGESKDLGDVQLADEEEFRKSVTSALKNSGHHHQQEHQQSVSVVSGRIALPGGAPAVGAHVAVTAMRLGPSRGGDLSPPGAVLAESTVGQDGSYQLRIEGASSTTHQYAALIARRDDAALGWKRIDLDQTPVEISLELKPEELVRGRLVDIEGQPAANVQVSVQSVVAGSGGGTLSQDGVGYRGDQVPAAWLQPVVSDAKGQFTISGVPDRCGLFLSIEGNERFAPQQVALNTGQPEQRGERDRTYRPLVKNVASGEIAVIPLAPAQLFQGVVTFENTGEPAPSARLTIWASQQEFGSMVSVPGRTDSKGRYRISPKPGIRFGITAYPPDGTPYLARRTPLSDAIRWTTGDRVKQVDVSLPRGVLVRGQVVEAGTGSPVAGASIQYLPESLNNSNTADDILTGWQGIQLSDNEGNFSIAVLPGPGRLVVHGPANRYVLQEIAERQLSQGKPGGRRNYAHAVHEIDLDRDTEAIDVTISLQQGERVVGRIVDSGGVMVSEALVITRLNISPLSLTWRGHTTPTLGGRFELFGLERQKKYPVHVLDSSRQLGATATVQAGDPEPTISLHPCGRASATFVDAEGQPHVGFQPGLSMVVTPGAHEHDYEAARRGELLADADFVANIDRTNYWPGPQTDSQGKVTFPALIPGATYRLSTFSDGKPKVLKQFTVQSEEELDLGKIVLDLED